jgi:hypothetical protein
MSLPDSVWGACWLFCLAGFLWNAANAWEAWRYERNRAKGNQ